MEEQKEQTAQNLSQTKKSLAIKTVEMKTKETHDIIEEEIYTNSKVGQKSKD